MLFANRAIFMIAWLLPLSSSADETPPTNLIVINIQQLGWGDVGLYSPWRSDTPNIDALAKDGVTLDSLYCETSATASAGTFLSGKQAASWGLYSSNNAEPTQLHENSGFILPADLVLLPHILGNNSYNTKFLGRWNLGQRPQANPVNFGFKSFQGTVSDLGSKYDDLRYPNIGFYRNGNIVRRIYDSDDSDFGVMEKGIANFTKLYTQEAALFVEITEEPFYLHLSLDALVHPPYRSQEYVGSSSGSRATAYTDALQEIDNLVGELTATLERLGKKERTLIVLTADSTALASHFVAGSNNPFSGETGDTTEGGVRVPGLLSLPGYNFNTSRSEQVMNLADLHVTVLSLLGMEVPKCEEEKCVAGGMDVSQSLTTGQPINRTVAIYRGRTLMAIRMGRHKAHRMSISSFVPGQFLDTLTSYALKDTTANPILYDVVADPSERFFVGGGFDAVSARYSSTMPAMKDEINYVLENVVMTGGLLNECNDAFREWAPPGCAQFELCLQPSQDKLKMCVIPQYG